jgi:hypothetical protein
MSEWASSFADGRVKRALVGSALLWAGACADAAPAEPVGKTAIAVATAAQAVSTLAATGQSSQKSGDRSSTPGVAIDWIKPTNQELRVVLKHKRDFPTDATVGVELTAPDGSNVQYTLANLVLDAASVETLTLDLRALPLKSSARGTQMRLWVEYLGMGLGRDGKVEAAPVRVLARPAYVLHDARFESATVRDEAEEQLRFEAMSNDQRAPRLEVRADAARSVQRPRADGTVVHGGEIAALATTQPAARGDISADSAQGRLAPGGDVQ